MDGNFTHTGSYKKYETEQVTMGALYPFKELNAEEISLTIKSMCNKMASNNFWGYVSFEILLNDKNEKYFFIGVKAQLDEYSSFYFYCRYLLSQQKQSIIKSLMMSPTSL